MFRILCNRCSRGKSWLAKTVALAAVCVALAAGSAMAADATWTTCPIPTWDAAGGWRDGVIPGSTTDSGVNNGDLAYFNKQITTWGGGNVSPSNSLYLGGLQFGGSLTSFTIGTFGDTIFLAPDGSTGHGRPMVNIDSTLTTVGQSVTLTPKWTYLYNDTPGAVASTYSIINNAPTGTNFTFGIASSSYLSSKVAALSTIVLGGSNTNAIWTGKIVDGNIVASFDSAQTNTTGATSGLTKTGTGTWTIDPQTWFISGPINVQQGTLKLTQTNPNEKHFAGSVNPAAAPSLNIAAGAFLDVSGGSGAKALGLFTHGAPNFNDQGITLSGNGTVSNGTVIAGNAATYGTVTMLCANGSTSGAMVIRPGDSTTGVGTLTTGSLIMASPNWGYGQYTWGVNSVSGWGLQAAANAGNGYSGGSQLAINGTLDLSHLSATNKLTINVNSLNGNAPGAVSGWNMRSSYQWSIATFTGGLAAGSTFNPNYFTINTAGFTSPFTSGTGLGFSLTADANNLYLNYVSGSESTAYSLAATVTGSANILKGATTAVRATITNTGVGGGSTLTYTGLNISPSSGTILGALPKDGAAPIAVFGSDSGTGTFIATVYGNATLTPVVATVTDNTTLGPAPLYAATTSTVNVGIATTVGLKALGGTVLTGQVTAGQAFANLASKTLANAGNGVVGSEATLTGGKLAAGGTVSMDWRTRTDAEKNQAGGGLVSDVVNLAGLVAGDLAAVQVQYNAAELQSIWNQASTDTNGIRLAYLSGSKWVDAGSIWMGDMLAPTGAELSADAGWYGIDTASGTVWAVVAQNGQLAAVPEPGTIGLMLSGILALAGFAHRRRK